MEKILLWYAVAINIIAYAVFGIDKFKAKKGMWRIPEKTLLGLCAIGGAGGGLIAMNSFKHKRQKPLFKILVPLFLIIQVLLVGIYTGKTIGA